MGMLYEKGRLRIDLGTGDVGISFGGKRDFGAIGFKPISPHQIGEQLGPSNDKAAELPVSILFHDPRSIDVLIMACKQAKAIMITGTTAPTVKEVLDSEE